eukprot:1460642-Alexandrium_andersonii.AAC.1
MSASLVGSEMCIRDRCDCIRGRAALRLRFILLVAIAIIDLLALVRHAGAVSYTHLTLPTICSV